MSAPPRTAEVQIRRSAPIRVAIRAFGFAALWAILSSSEGWPVGVPVVLLATAVNAFVLPVSRWSLTGLARFLPYFVGNSLRAAVDVAARAMNPRLPIDPVIVCHPMQLESAEARVVMANVVTLLPGTVSADLQGKVLRVHVLNASGPFEDTLDTLERRVADLFLHDYVETPP